MWRCSAGFVASSAARCHAGTAASGVPDRVEKLCHTVPMQRGGSALEVAECIIWLMSDKSSYVTDALLDVAGGR